MTALKNGRQQPGKKRGTKNSAKHVPPQEGIGVETVPPDPDLVYSAVKKALGVEIDREQTSDENLMRLYKMMQYTGRTNVGSGNPYAAVEHELGIKVDWASSRPDAVERLLEKGKKLLLANAREDTQGGKSA